MESTEDQVAGALLLSARTRLGLSQTAFAELLGIAQPTLSAYESGRRQPTLPTLLRLLGRAGLDLRMKLGNGTATTRSSPNGSAPSASVHGRDWRPRAIDS